MYFEIKHDVIRKAYLITGGHMVTLHNMSAQSTVVKCINVWLLGIIAHIDKLSILCGYILNTFLTTPYLEKVYSVTSPEFKQ